MGVEDTKLRKDLNYVAAISLKGTHSHTCLLYTAYIECILIQAKHFNAHAHHAFFSGSQHITVGQCCLAPSSLLAAFAKNCWDLFLNSTLEMCSMWSLLCVSLIFPFGTNEVFLQVMTDAVIS